MSKRKSLSKEAESRIMDVLNDVAVHVSDLEHPNDAIIKAAQEHSLPVGHINMVVHAYNTGRQAKQRMSGGDPFDKTADFTLASAPAILERMYPTQVKTAAAAANETVVSDEYSHPPHFLRHQKGMAKAAANLPPMVEQAPAPYPTDPNHEYNQKAAAAQRAKVASQNVRREMRSKFDELNTAFNELVGYFSTPGHTQIKTAEEHASVMQGDSVPAIFCEIRRRQPKLDKFAGVDRRYEQTAQPYPLIRKIAQLTIEYRELQQNTEQVKEAEAQARSGMLPFGEGRRPSPSILAGVSCSKEAGMLGGAATMGLGGFLSNLGRKASTPATKEMEDTIEELADPAHEMELQRIAQRQQFDEMQNDPIIAGYDTEEVINAYNAISQMAPRAAGQPLAMQTLMRKYLSQGQLDPFEVDTLLGLETKLKQRDALPKEESGSLLAGMSPSNATS
jgi:hypothetical protein